jgi:hypothetical protein
MINYVNTKSSFSDYEKKETVFYSDQYGD